jgi:hypothetical protein
MIGSSSPYCAEMRSITPGSTVRVLPPAMRFAGSPGSRKNKKNRNDSARNTVGMIKSTRRRM